MLASINSVDKPVDKSVAGNNCASDMARDMPKRAFRGNQWTKRSGAIKAERNAERWQENPKYQAGALLGMLRSHASGKLALTQTQIKSIELMLDRVAPRLSAVEQTTIEPAARLSEAEIRAQLADLVANHSGMLQELIAEHARAAIQARAEPSIAQSDSTDSTQPIELIGQAHG